WPWGRRRQRYSPPPIGSPRPLPKMARRWRCVNSFWEGAEANSKLTKLPRCCAEPSRRRGGEFQLNQIAHGLGAALATHLRRGTQPTADSRAVGVTKEQTAVVGAELHTAHPRRFALGHPRNRRRDRRRNATRPTAHTTIHTRSVC